MRGMEQTPVPSKQPLAQIIFVCVLLIITGTVFYFLGKAQNIKTRIVNPPIIPSSQPPQIAAWKTYSNAKYNYTIEYPGDWTFSEYPDSKNGASFDNGISISAGKTLLNYANQTLEEYAKIAGTEIQNYNKLASLKKVTTLSGAVGYETTWMVQPMTINGVPPTAKDSESLPITYFEIPGDKTTLVRVTLDRKEDLAIYEKMIVTVKINTPLTPIPTVDEASVLRYVIKKYIALKHKSDENSLTITVSKIEGNYAQGSVSEEGGGGMWFAEKNEGAWMLIWDGNGIIECSLFTLHPNFPTNMIPECYDTVKQNTVKR
jgi:hypothetical protein